MTLRLTSLDPQRIRSGSRQRTALQLNFHTLQSDSGTVKTSCSSVPFFWTQVMDKCQKPSNRCQQIYITKIQNSAHDHTILVNL